MNSRYNISELYFKKGGRVLELLKKKNIFHLKGNQNEQDVLLHRKKQGK